MDISDYFDKKLDEKYEGEDFLSSLKKNLLMIDHDSYFKLGLDEKYGDGKDFKKLLKSKLYSIDIDNYFKLKLNKKYGEKFKSILEKN